MELSMRTVTTDTVTCRHWATAEEIWYQEGRLAWALGGDVWTWVRPL